MSGPTVNHNLAELNEALRLYVRAAGRGMAFAIAKQSSELGRNLAKEAKGLMPAKGAITSERLSALKSGEGIRISQSVISRTAEKFQISPKYGPVLFRKRAGLDVKVGLPRIQKGNYVGSVLVDGKRMNLQALMVHAELKSRESGRGFLSRSQMLALGYKAWDVGEARQIDSSFKDYTVSKFGPNLGEYSISVNPKNTRAVFKWGGFSKLSDDIVKAMGRTRGQAAVARAIEATTDNMIPYLNRKLGEEAVKAKLR